MRSPGLLLLGLPWLVGCGTSGGGPGVDGGIVAEPDLLPTCLPVEPEPPSVDPDCPIVKPAAHDALDDALAKAGLDRCTLALPTSSFGLRDPYRLPWYDRVHDHPVNGPAFARTLATRLDEAASSSTPVARQLVLLGNRLGSPITACVPAPLLDATQPLARAVARLISEAGGAPDHGALESAAAGVPLDLQFAVATVVLAVADANLDWKSLTANLSSDDLFNLAATSGMVLPGAGGGVPDLTASATKTLLSRTWDSNLLVSGAARLAAAVERAGLARFAGAYGFSLDVKTPVGRIVLRGAGDDTYPDDGGDAIAVLVDTGGNDTYEAPVGAVGSSQMVDGEPIHVAVALDLAGNDSYGYLATPSPLDTTRDKAMDGVKRLPSDLEGRYRRRSPSDDGPISLSDQVRQGGARLGYALLFDLGAGADHYRSLRMSQGFGCAGVGVLYDAGGDDVYEGEAGVQGAGIFGVGLLLDAGGNDTYKTYTEAQGFAYARGAGLLYDGGGDDKYLADSGIPALGGDPIYYSPQAPCDSPGAPCGNSSFVQGAGFGRRAPQTNGDTANMSGGLGVLRDLAGDDVYLASIFGQATGYWFGTGILADAAGADRYDGWWYTQGSAAHAALCVFLDDSGDDRYDQTYPMNPPYATNTGQGHDFSVGWHLDLGGSDRYRAPGLGLGGGNANGAGLFVNIGGDDVYETPGGTVLGGAAFSDSARPPTTPCYGLFLDVGGRDTYMVPADPHLMPQPADNTSWTNPRDDPPFNDRSVGVDRESGTVSLP